MKLTEEQIEGLVNLFLAWPLPESVCADQCATKQGYPNRSGTNLLSAVEAKQMFEYLFANTRHFGQEVQPACVWSYDSHTESWDTKCGEKFQFTNDGPKENGMKFCPYCGNTLTEKHHVESSE